MFNVGDLVSFRVLMGYDGSGSVWTWKEGIGHVTGALYLQDGAMFYEVVDAEGVVHEVLETEITGI